MGAEYTVRARFATAGARPYSPGRPRPGRAANGMARANKMRLPAAVYLLGLTSLLNDAASDMIYPLLPLFLAGSIGAGTVALGIIEGAAEATASLLKLVTGHLSDRARRRKPFVVVGYVIATAVRPLLALAGSAGAVLAIRMTDRLGKGIRSSPRDALIADVVEPRQRGRAFGVHEAMDHAGAVVGPLVAAALLGLGFSLPVVFVAALVPGVLACLVIGFLVREPPHPEPIAAAVLAPVAAPAPAPPLLARPFVAYLAAVGVFSLGGSADAFLIMRAHELGLSQAGIPLLWAFHNACKAVATAHGGALADRFGRRRAVALGWLVYALVYAGFAWATSLSALIALFALYAVHYALSAGAQKALVADLVPAARRARGYGAYHLVVGLALLPASALFGLVYLRWGAGVAFAAGASLALLAVVLLPLSQPRPAAPPR